MLISRLSKLVCGLLLVLQSGCASKATDPSVTQVDLALGASSGVGDPANPVVADARADNVGNTRVWHCVGCGCGYGFRFEVIGPDGAVVQTSDPNGPRTLCADNEVALDPGAAVGDRFFFTGTLYAPGPPGQPWVAYPAPLGDYTLVGFFSYTTSNSAPRVHLERRLTFHWQ